MALIISCGDDELPASSGSGSGSGSDSGGGPDSGGGSGGSQLRPFTAVVSQSITRLRNWSSLNSTLYLSRTNVDCSNGQPTGSNSGDATYPESLTWCQLNTNTKSPDSLEVVTIWLKDLCVLLKTLILTLIIRRRRVDISLLGTDSCWGDDGMDFNEDGSVNSDDVVVVSIAWRPSTNSDFDYYVGFQEGAIHDGNESNNIIKINFLQRSDKVGLRIADYPSVGSANGSVADASLTTSGLYWEVKDYTDKRHSRMRVDGTFDISSGELSSPTKLFLIWTQGDESNAGSDSRNVVMSYQERSGSTWSDQYDHWVGSAGGATARDSDFSAITEISHNSGFILLMGEQCP